MVNNRQEQVSALVDGELEGGELQRALNHLKDEPELRERWQRYHLISDTLHNSLPDHVIPDLRQRVAERLKDEPVILAPKPRTIHVPGLLRRTAGLAAAASVTAVAILGMQYINGERNGYTTTAQTTPPAASTAMRASVEAVQGAPADPALDPYVVNHNEYSVSSGMQGVLPYVRIVSHGSDE
jgi:sigma-E factor negative regulatory protein RseA